MTNEEAIKYLIMPMQTSTTPSEEYQKQKKAYDLAIEALRRQDVTDTNVGDLVSRQDVIELVKDSYYNLAESMEDTWAMVEDVEMLPSVEPEPLSQAYARTVWTWLLNYQIKSAELKGAYSPYEVLSWVTNDWRKENGLDKQTGGD